MDIFFLLGWTGLWVGGLHEAVGRADLHGGRCNVPIIDVGKIGMRRRRSVIIVVVVIFLPLFQEGSWLHLDPRRSGTVVG